MLDCEELFGIFGLVEGNGNTKVMCVFDLNFLSPYALPMYMLVQCLTPPGFVTPGFWTWRC